MSIALSLVVCGAPLASRAPDVAGALVRAGWEVTVVASPAARSWLDEHRVEVVTGQRPRFDQGGMGQPRRPRPVAVVACPLTLNSGSKAALGIMDTYATGVLCEALASGIPLTAVLMVSNRLWGHPAWAAHLRTLGAEGTRFVNIATGSVGDPTPVVSGTGTQLVTNFDPIALASVVGPPR